MTRDLGLYGGTEREVEEDEAEDEAMKYEGYEKESRGA